MNLLGIGLDYLMVADNTLRGDVRERQLEYAKNMESYHQIIYSPKHLNLKPQKWGENLFIYPTNSSSKTTFILDALKLGKKICRENKIDAITAEDPFSTGLVGYLLKKKFRIPLNVQAHIDFVDNEYWMSLRRMNRIFNVTSKFICKRADTIRVVASETKEDLVRCGVDEKKITLLSVHSDLSRFKQADGSETRKKYLNDKYDQILLFVGRLVDQKDIPNLLSAMQLILQKRPKTLLLIVGDGPKRKEMEGLAKELKVDANVIFTGGVTHAEIGKIYSACDIFVLPSIFEGRATVIVEAILSGKPIVSTKVSGLREWIINGETGFIVPRKDPVAFAEKVCWLLDNPQKARVFGEKGLELCKDRFNEIGKIDNMINLWRKTAEAKVKSV